MKSFLVTAPLLKLLLQVQEHLKGSSIDTLRINSTTIKFLDSQEDQVSVDFAPELRGEPSEADRMLLYVQDLYKRGDSHERLDPIEGENWEQQMDYLCIRLQLCQLDRVTLLQHYYRLGERIAIYNWNTYTRQEMKDRFTSGKYKKAVRTARWIYAFYQIRGVHNLLVSDYISAYAILVMTKENFELLLEKATKRRDEEMKLSS
ncbi:698_t:CDS:1, partial [Racocetra fulgida]